MHGKRLIIVPIRKLGGLRHRDVESVHDRREMASIG